MSGFFRDIKANSKSVLPQTEGLSLDSMLSVGPVLFQLAFLPFISHEKSDLDGTNMFCMKPVKRLWRSA